MLREQDGAMPVIFRTRPRATRTASLLAKAGSGGATVLEARRA